jgi:hypothetical protein
MKIIVFVNEPAQSDQTYAAQVLKDNGFMFLVDAVHGKDVNWLKENFQHNNQHRFFCINDDGKDFAAFPLAMLPNPPTFVVMGNDDDQYHASDWVNIFKYFHAMLRKDMNLPASHRLKQILAPLLLPPQQAMLMEKADTDDIPMEEEESDNYQCNYVHYPKDDIALVEIRKPKTDRPYTVVIRQFSEKGFLPLFSSLFIADSWGCEQDKLFLTKLWPYMKMEGVCDLEKLLQDHTEACLPGEGKIPTAEPEVYRRTLDDTKAQLEKKSSLFIA